MRIAISIILTHKTENTINASLFKFKNKHKRIYTLIYGKANDKEIFDCILGRLNGKFDILMIHSSLNDMIPMYTGNPGKLLSMIMEYCRQNNITLVMPTLFDGSNLQAKKFYENGKNKFDVRRTFSGMGLISEMFRKTKDIKRSIHPTHSVCALGPLADRLTGNHHLSKTTCGEGTPFGEMIKYRTMILGIGANAEALTQVHSAEDMMKDKFPIRLFKDTLPITCIDESGNTLIYNLRIKNPEYVIDKKLFYKILKKMKITEWTYKGIPFFLTQANVVTETFIEAARNGQTIYRRISLGKKTSPTPRSS